MSRPSTPSSGACAAVVAVGEIDTVGPGVFESCRPSLVGDTRGLESRLELKSSNNIPEYAALSASGL
jgi:hypothetical protein